MFPTTFRLYSLLLLIAIALTGAGTAHALNVGDPAPNIYGKTLDNQLFRLSQITQPTVVNFFWVECKPCIKEMPELAKLAKAHPQIHVIAVHVGEEDQATIQRFLHSLSAHPGTIVRTSPAVKDSYQIRALPHTVVIHQGKITGIVEGYTQTGWNNLLQLVRALPSSP